MRLIEITSKRVDQLDEGWKANLVGAIVGALAMLSPSTNSSSVENTIQDAAQTVNVDMPQEDVAYIYEIYNHVLGYRIKEYIDKHHVEPSEIPRDVYEKFQKEAGKLSTDAFLSKKGAFDVSRAG